MNIIMTTPNARPFDPMKCVWRQKHLGRSAENTDPPGRIPSR